MKFTPFAALFVLATGTVLAASAPQADGIYYYVTNPLTGEEMAVKMGEVNTTIPLNTRSDLIKSAKFAVEKRQSLPGNAICDHGDPVPADLYSVAESNLQQTLLAAGNWHKKLSVSYGVAVAFACDYGKGQSTDANQYTQMMSNLDSTCKNTGSGWWTIPQWKASYGRTILGKDFC